MTTVIENMTHNWNVICSLNIFDLISFFLVVSFFGGVLLWCVRDFIKEQSNV